MTVEQVRNLLYKASNEDQVVILNDNAPVKAASQIEQAFVMESGTGDAKKVVLVYKSGKEGRE